jgi:hypothetical protein
VVGQLRGRPASLETRAADAELRDTAGALLSTTRRTWRASGLRGLRARRRS